MKRISILIIAITALAAGCPCGVSAQEAGRITYVEGRVDISPAGAAGAAAAQAGSVVNVGDSVRAKSNSRAEVAFADSSRLRIAENTKVTVADYRLNADNSRAGAAIMLDRGKIRATIAGAAGGAPFGIMTPNAAGTVEGSDVYAFFQAGNSGMLVAEGELSVTGTSHPGTALRIPAGSAVLVPADGDPKGPRQYLDMELRFFRTDTDIPETTGRKDGVTFMRGTVVKVTGSVMLTGKSGMTRDARAGDVIEEGCAIVTGRDGMAEISFDNGNAMYLKPGSNISALKLMADPGTGVYESLFRAGSGKIKSRIEKLGGGSKFEVKTPTALCGARGTIMYLDIALTGATDAFFEGGNGYARSEITGRATDIGAGDRATVGSDGSISDPAPVSQEERLEIDEGWDVEGPGSEDGTIPGGAAGFLLSAKGGLRGQNPIEQASSAAAGTDPVSNGMQTTVDVPITVAHPPQTSSGTGCSSPPTDGDYGDGITAR